jgi:hypothetical protein
MSKNAATQKTIDRALMIARGWREHNESIAAMISGAIALLPDDEKTGYHGVLLDMAFDAAGSIEHFIRLTRELEQAGGDHHA